MPDTRDDPLPPPPLPAWLEPHVPFERYAMTVEGMDLHVMETGRGRPVLLLHGNPAWGFLYRKVARELAGEPLRLVMPDLPGLGFSGRPASAADHTLDNHGRWLRGLVDALGLDEMIFVAHDWGGPIGLRMFADAPERLAGLVVLNTALGPPKPGFQPTAFHRFARLPVVSTAAFRLAGFPQNAMHRAQGDPASIRGEVARAYRYPLRRKAGNEAPLALARMVPDSLEHPSVEPLERCQTVVQTFSGPAAIVWGDRDPVLGRLRTRVERLLPDAPVTRTEAGHFLQEEVPAEIAAAIRRVARG